MNKGSERRGPNLSEARLRYDPEGKINRFLQVRSFLKREFAQAIDQVEADESVRDLMHKTLDALLAGGTNLIRSKRSAAVKEKELPSHKKDVVTQTDIDTQKIVFEVLEQSFGADNQYLVGEEGVSGNKDSHSVFLVDALDGTRAFMHGYDDYSMSLAHEQDGVLDFAFVFAPEKGKIFFGNRQGSYSLDIDGTRKIKTETRPFTESVFYSDFSDVVETDEMNEAMAHFWADIRGKHKPFKEVRYNSAALGIPDTVEKSGNIFIGFDLELVDVAAGAYCALKAGSKVWTSITKERPGFILVTNGDPETEELCIRSLEHHFPEYYHAMYQVSADQTAFK